MCQDYAYVTSGVNSPQSTVVAALLDPSRPSRARPTPADLLRASDATGIPFVELLEALWGIEPSRLADELAMLGLSGSADIRLKRLSEAECAEVSDFADFLVSRQMKARRRSRLTTSRS